MGKHRHAVTHDYDYGDSDYDDDYYFAKSQAPQPPPKPPRAPPHPKEPKKPSAQATSKSQPLPQRSLNLSIVGHVDAGKSTLLGNLLHQLDVLPKKTVEKNQREAARAGRCSFGFAWCLDEMDEERARGITMDVGIVGFRSGSFWVNAFDTPGHVDYVSKMIEVTCLSDVLVLIVSAAPGEFESGFDCGGQTREIITIGRCLDVRRVIVAVNKMDAAAWAEDRFLEIRRRVAKGLTDLGYTSNVTFIPCSGYHGVNLLTCDSPRWYCGMSLVEAVDSVTVDRPPEDYFRGVAVSVRRRSNRAGLEIQLLVRSGQLRVGDFVVVFPARVGIVVRDLAVRGFPGEVVASVGDVADVGFALAEGGPDCLSVEEVTEDHVFAGCLLSSDTSKSVSLFKAKIQTLSAAAPITVGFTCEIYCNGSCGSVVLTRIDRIVKSRKQTRTFLSSNCTALVQFQLASPNLMVEYDRCKPMGKFILLHNARTLAVGVVTELCS